MEKNEFIQNFLTLMEKAVGGLSKQKKAQLAEKILCESASLIERPLRIKLIPFIPGRRPENEILYPGLGSSSNIGFIFPETIAERNFIYILYEICGVNSYSSKELQKLKINVTLSLKDPDDSFKVISLKKWNRLNLAPQIFTGDNEILTMTEISLENAEDKHLVLQIPTDDVCISDIYSTLSTLDTQSQEQIPEKNDLSLFNEFFSKQLNIKIELSFSQIIIDCVDTSVEIYDLRNFGKLYDRLLDKLLPLDVASQCCEHLTTCKKMTNAYHPLYPIVRMISDRAAITKSSIIKDNIRKKVFLSDALWLVRFELYLEFLITISLLEAAKNDIKDILTPEERTLYQNSPEFSKLRERINIPLWSNIWQLHEIVFAENSKFAVAMQNLEKKWDAIKILLDPLLDAIKAAAELAGPNIFNFQTLWCQLFEDSEMALLKIMKVAFPEISLFEHSGDADLKNINRTHLNLQYLTQSSFIQEDFGGPPRLYEEHSSLFSGFVKKYLKGMNLIAEKGKKNKFFDYCGKKCIPEKMSSFESLLVQRNLTFSSENKGLLKTTVSFPAEISLHDQAYTLLKSTCIFEIIPEEDLKNLANVIRPIKLKPLEKIISQGDQGSSLFIVLDGSLDVYLSNASQINQKLVGTIEKGGIFGEMSLLTGSRRSNTVCASSNGAIIFEIAKKQYQNIIASNPEIISTLGHIMSERLKQTQTLSPKAISRRILNFFMS